MGQIVLVMNWLLRVALQDFHQDWEQSMIDFGISDGLIEKNRGE